MSLKKKPSINKQKSLFPPRLEDLRWMTKEQIYGGVLPGSPKEKANALLIKKLFHGGEDEKNQDSPSYS